MKASSVLLLLLPAFALAQSTTTTAPPAWTTGVETEDGSCGVAAGWVCSPTWGACCSKDNMCGRSAAFCGDGCQPSFGNCNAIPPAPPGPGSISPDGSCGGTNKYNCTGSSFGNCCSGSGFCGSSTDHCGATCDPLFGTCPSGSQNITTNGQCGANGKTCKGGTFGSCCSGSGFCGDTDAHCTSGCQSGFGTCAGSSGGNISTDGSCGANNKTCKGSQFGDCCSGSNFCGSSSDFCGAGCQSGFGNCTSSSNISTDGSCSKNGKTCKGSTFGDCCSSAGFCGKTSDFCGAGCQSGFGNCTSTSNISIDGSCSKNGKTCKGSTFGDCCSSAGFCGKTTDFCGTGCQASFGNCSAPTTISTDGACGKNGKTCKGSTFGDCCSASGFCGKTTEFCDSGCQTAFGTCNAGSGSISTDGACGTKNSKTCVGSTFGNCCSSSGFCGKTANFCGQGCQKSASSACITTNIPSVNGDCGSTKGGFTCAGGDFNGQCCSSGGFCGTTTAHCGTGCQKSYGKCT